MIERGDSEHGIRVLMAPELVVELSTWSQPCQIMVERSSSRFEPTGYTATMRAGPWLDIVRGLTPTRPDGKLHAPPTCESQGGDICCAVCGREIPASVFVYGPRADVTDHEPDCPWRMAVELRRTIGDLPGDPNRNTE